MAARRPTPFRSPPTPTSPPGPAWRKDASHNIPARSVSARSDTCVSESRLNDPASGGTYGAPTVESTTTVVGSTNITLKESAFFNELDAWGAMGLLGFSFDYRP